MAIVTEDFAGEFMTASDPNYRLQSCSCKLCAKTKSLSSGPYTVSVHVKMSVFGTGCTLSGPTVRTGCT